MSNFKVSQLPASTALVVEDILPVVDVSEMLTKKAEVGDLIDLAANTIESMPNLIVDPENNFTNFSQAVRTQITAGDGITYTAATGQVKLTNKSITINSTVVNLGDSISIPSGPTYTAGTGISLAGNIITNTAPGVTYTQGTGISIVGNVISAAPVVAGVTSINSIAQFSNLTFSPSNGNVTADFASEPTFFTIVAAATNGNGGNSVPPKRGNIAHFITDLDKTALKTEVTSSNPETPAVFFSNKGSAIGLQVRQNFTSTGTAMVVQNFGTGDSFIVFNTSDIEDGKFIIDNEGRTGIGMDGSISAKLQVSHFGAEPSMKINDTFVIDTAGNLAIGSNTVDQNLSKIILGVNGSSMFDGVHSNKAVLRLTATDTNIGNHNFIYASGSNVTGTLPDIFTQPIGTEYTFRKFSNANMLIRPFNSSQLIEFVANGTIPLTGTGNVFIKIKSIEQSPIGRTWIIVQLSSTGGGGFIAVPP